MSDKKSKIYASFLINSKEYAIESEYVQQIIGVPKETIASPMENANIKSFFDFRGSLCALAVMDGILDSGHAAHGASGSHLLVCRIDDRYIGILIDAIGHIFPKTTTRFTEMNSSDPREQRVCDGIFRVGYPERAVLHVNAQRLIAKFGNDLVKASQNTKTNASQGVSKRLLQFRMGTRSGAINIENIAQIVSQEQLNGEFNHSTFYRGYLEKDGKMLNTIDFGRFLNQELAESAEEKPAGHVLVVDHDGRRLGLLVDDMEDIIEVAGGDLLPLAQTTANGLIESCIRKHDEQIVPVYNVEALLQDKQLAESVSASSQDRTPPPGNIEQNPKNVFVTFSLTVPCGINTKQLREIIEFPSKLLDLPRCSKAVLGFHDFRGKLIPIVDSRRLYNMQESNSGTKQVLIVRLDKQEFGLVIEELESLVQASKDEIFASPHAINDADVSPGHDAREMVFIRSGEKLINFLILDGLKLNDRIFGVPLK